MDRVFGGPDNGREEEMKADIVYFRDGVGLGVDFVLP